MRAVSTGASVAFVAAIFGCASPEPSVARGGAIATPAGAPAASEETVDRAHEGDRASEPAEVASSPALDSGPPPTPEPFPDRTEVRLDELIAAIDALADELADTPAVKRDYADLVSAQGLIDSPELYRDYVRIKLAFEATRDGGWWHLHWAITNEQPNSDEIWSQWDDAVVPDPKAIVATATATAECDELSALFAFVARKLDVHGIGLFWPTWNHVVAVWTIPGVQTEAGSPVRIIVPTSQIFLTQDDSLGTDAFDPWKQKTIYEYRRRDVKAEHRIDADLARFFVCQIAAHGRASQAELQRARNVRAARLSAG